MDVRRLQLWEGRNAVMLSNEALRSVIEDQGGMVIELSNINNQGGRINAHPMYWFRGTGYSLASDENHDFWRDSNLLYHLGGAFFCFPNFGGGHTYKNVFYEPHGWTANNLWTVVKYGTDFETGANWVVSSMTGPDQNYRCGIKKIDMVLPNHPVLYSSISITNSGSAPLRANAAWHNTVGSPFLESGCLIDVCADRFATAVEESEFKGTARLAMGKEFNDLGKVPARDGSTLDISVVPGMIGHTDFVTGSVPNETRLGWSSVLNPRLKMVYVSFFSGPSALSDDDIPLYFNNLWMQYGGRPMTPWALYDGGTDQTFCLGVENSTGYYAEGLAKSVGIETFLGHPTTVEIPVGATRFQRYGTAFAPLDNPKMMNGIQSIDQSEEGIILKHGKAWGFIEADSSFTILKAIERKVLE